MTYNRRYIQKKPCKHDQEIDGVECSNMPKLGAGGYCWKHEKEDSQYQSKVDKKHLKKESCKIRLLSNSTLVDNEGAREFQTLQNWFRDAAIELSKHPYCAECDKWIAPPFYRAATAHVLPKRKEYGFPSVSTHPLNRIFLCAGEGCHKKYDNTWQGASLMKVWPLVLVIFKELYPFIAESEKKNLPDILRLEIKENI